MKRTQIIVFVLFSSKLFTIYHFRLVYQVVLLPRTFKRKRVIRLKTGLMAKNETYHV